MCADALVDCLPECAGDPTSDFRKRYPGMALKTGNDLNRGEIRLAFLIGEKLYLRPLEESDIGEEYRSWLNNREVTRYLETGRFPVTSSDLRKYLERFQNSTTDVIFAIIAREAGQHIGNVTLNRINWIHRTADTGLMIGRKEFWGKGYAFEAWSLTLDYAFEHLGLRKIIAGAVVDNLASIHVLKKLGFKVEGTLRQEFLLDGEYRDAIRMGLFRSEFYKFASGDVR